MTHTVGVQQTLKQILQPVPQQIDKRKATANALSTFGIMVKLLCHLAYLGILRKIIFER
jgi:hypothetical protein